MAGFREQLRHPAAPGRGIGGLGRSAGRRDDAAVVRDRIAFAQGLHREVPHDLERPGQAPQVGPARARDPPRLLGRVVKNRSEQDGRPLLGVQPQEQANDRIVGLDGGEIVGRVGSEEQRPSKGA